MDTVFFITIIALAALIVVLGLIYYLSLGHAIKEASKYFFHEEGWDPDSQYNEYV